ncbi:TetR/AcrR family transcriptional regulator [Aeromicrobium sp.]|uniref:TetR/AcrR family transcriptional regulator n=1 Tax=Aeromicrobium sp. TaxID=1871063 RepID=UPI0030BEEAB4
MTPRQDAILQAAARCIARQGVRGLRVHDVAAEADVSTSLLYYHFTDREGLLAATLDHINDVSADHRLARAAGETALDRLEALLLGEIRDDDDIRTGSIAWNELRATAVFEAGLREPLAHTTATWNSRVRAALDDVGASGDTDHLATILTALIEGVSGRWLGGELSTDHARTLIRTAIHHLITATGKST